MSVFSDMDMGFTDGTGSPFEDEGAFGQTPKFEQMESLPVSGGQMAEEIELPVPQAGSQRITDDTDSEQQESKKDWQSGNCAYRRQLYVSAAAVRRRLHGSGICWFRLLPQG